MSVNLLMPKIGLNMVEGQITEWVVKEGQSVKKGDVVYVVETDKVANDVEAPQDGILLKILVPAGEVAPVREVVGILAGANEEVDLNSVLNGMRKERRQKEMLKPETAEKIRGPQKAADDGRTGDILASPLAKRLAAQNGIELSEVKGSGPAGRITSEDIEEFITTRDYDCVDSDLLGRLVPLAGVRKIVAERMSHAVNTMAMVTINSELDVTPLITYHDTSKKSGREKKEIPSYNAILIFLVAKVLKKNPYLNASLMEQGIKLFDRINLGLGVDTSEGLKVVVIRDANSKSLDDIHKELSILINRAQNHRSKPQDLAGGTFTITNLGMYGVDSFNPIINPPETGILGIGRFIEKEILKDSKPVRKHMAIFSLTFDHRVIDGAPAAQFLQQLGEMITEFKK